MNVAVFIDGANLYKKLKELNIKHTSRFDYWSFIKSLIKNDKISFVGYYVGQVHREKGNQKSEELYANQQKLFAYLKKNIPKLQIKRGHIQNYNGLYKEKGVGVKIALDIYELASKNVYDKAILISSNSDLMPAVCMAQDLNKMIEYIGFSHNLSMALVKECKLKRFLNYDDLNEFQFKKQ